MFKYGVVLVLLALFPSASHGAGIPANIPNVSLVSLIATPDRFENSVLRVQGIAYLDSKHYINAIFLTREDKIRGNSANAIFLYFSPAIRDADRLNGKFVIVEGKFTSENKGHLNAFPGSLIEVTRVETVQGRNGD
jgi:hypothetical protein